MDVDRVSTECDGVVEGPRGHDVVGRDLVEAGDVAGFPHADLRGGVHPHRRGEAGSVLAQKVENLRTLSAADHLGAAELERIGGVEANDPRRVDDDHARHRCLEEEHLIAGHVDRAALAGRFPRTEESG